MKLNTAASKPKIYTHEGAVARRINPEQQLRRSVMSCLLWENEFYEDGKTIAERIMEYAAKVDTDTLASIINEARNVHGLRHAPLLMLLTLIRTSGEGVAGVVANTMRRADDMTELVHMYWTLGGNKHMLPRQMKLGLAMTFKKFNEYKLAKYDRDGAVKLRDVLKLVRPKPDDLEQSALFNRVKTRTMATPDTWEVALSGGADKKEAFTRLLKEHIESKGKFGIPYMAILRNLRNMVSADVELNLMVEAIEGRHGADLVFPFRFTAAARAAPLLEPYLDRALIAGIEKAPKLKGTTALLIDVSGSMDRNLSAKSDLTRMDAAATLGSIVSSEQLRLFSFSNSVVEVPPRRGMAGVDVITKSQSHGGTALFDAVYWINQNVRYDRLIVITDEQASGPGMRFGSMGGIQGERSTLPDPTTFGYMINVASARNGVSYGSKWMHIDGFSEAVLRYIHELESEPVLQ